MSSSSSGPDSQATLVSPGAAASSRIIGTGEMAGLIRSFDWATTSVGPVDLWCDTLLTTVNLILASRHPMFLWWGPDLVQFYNDGYRPSIRADKHPSAVGQRGTECWPEIWPIIGPQIQSVMTQGLSTWNINQLVPINRNGKLEEVFWTYSYSPVRDKDGTVLGTLVVCSETTEQVLSERRLRALLAITVDLPSESEPPESQPLPVLAQSLVRKLATNNADLPFALLYLSEAGEFHLAGSTDSTAALADPANWALQQTVSSGKGRLEEDLQQRFGDLIYPPWPEPVTRAYILPLAMHGLPVQAVMVFGISPRLSFDNGYETFLQLIGLRLASLLQGEVQKRQLSDAAKRFRRLAEADPFGTVIGDLNGRISYVNRSLLTTLGYTEDEVLSGKLRWDKLTPPEFSELDVRAVHQIRTMGRCDVYEKVYTAKDGRRVPILIGAAAIDPSANEPEIAAFITDLTPLKIAQEELRTANAELERKVSERTAALEAEVADRQRAEDNLRQLTGRLLLARDEERRHLARELHDHAGQTLVALGINFSALLNAAKNLDPNIVELLTQSQQLSDDLSKEIRTLSYLLHPPLLDEAGLASALRWYVEGFAQRSGIAIDLDLPKQLTRLPRQLELVVFRVVQESLTNVHRHSGSRSASIHLVQLPNAVHFEVADQGKGISPERQTDLRSPQVGVGVRGMKERVRQFGGTLEIESTSAGTKVSVTIPLAS